MKYKLKLPALSFLLSITGIISIFFSLQEKNMLISQLKVNSEDFNAVTARRALAEYTGTQFLYDFFFTNEFYYIYIIILFLIVGFLSSSNLLNQRLTGLGNLHVSRSGYTRYLNTSIIYETKKVAFLIIYSMFFIFSFSLLVGKGFSSITIDDRTVNVFQSTMVFLYTIIILIVYTSIALIISLMLTMKLSNLYVSYIFPLAVFILIPILISSTFGNSFISIGKIINLFIPFTFLTETFKLLESSSNNSNYIFHLLFLFTIYLTMSISIYKSNKKYFSENYI